ncbi:MAG: zinc ribbon domain-containing protein [Bryobacteraceae bacterium]
MPIFEYRCEDCGAQFEKLMRSSDSAGPACPSCGEVHVRKELSTFAAHAGSGSREAPRMGGGCPAGMCRTPDVCGRN